MFFHQTTTLESTSISLIINTGNVGYERKILYRRRKLCPRRAYGHQKPFHTLTRVWSLMSCFGELWRILLPTERSSKELKRAVATCDFSADLNPHFLHYVFSSQAAIS